MTMTRFANDESLLIQAQNGDSEAVELYLSAFVPFLNTIAKRFFNPVLSSQELCQAGYIGLMLALQRYDDTQNVHFMTYAMPWVLGEMKKALRHASDLSKGQRRSQAIAQQLGKLSSILGREPRIDELADLKPIHQKLSGRLKAAVFLNPWIIPVKKTEKHCWKF